MKDNGNDLYKIKLQEAIDNFMLNGGCGDSKCASCPLNQLYVNDDYLCDILKTLVEEEDE